MSVMGGQMSRLTVVCVVLTLVAGFGVGAGEAQTVSSSWKVALADGATPFSSSVGTSSSVSESSSAVPSSAVVAVPPPLPAKKTSDDNLRVLPFSRIAIGTKTGTLGLGGQIATPLTRWLNLRGGFDLFNFGYNLTNSGTNYNAALHLKSGEVNADYYPFRRSSFHVSPGVLIFKSGAAASMFVPGGNTFSENDTDYTSDPNDPVTGNGSVLFSHTAMPMLTFGFGNMISRRENRHWSVPVEIGAAYTGHYTVHFNFAGSVCQTDGCGSVSDPSVQQNVIAEQNKINEEAKHFQIYPVLTSGVAYRF